MGAMRDEEHDQGGEVIRKYDPKKDRDGTDAVDRECEVGPAGGMSLHADLLGDPVARIRHSPHHLMLVAETSGPGGRIVGLIRGTVKSVATGKSRPAAPAFANVGYILGLRVAPSHRRMGIARRLVRRLEQWFELMGAEYAYMATDKSNEASLRLFTGRCGYSKFRTPSLLVHPVHSHRLKAPRHATVVRLGACDAEKLYTRRFAHVEFFPADIGAVLDNQHSQGTFLAIVDNTGGYEWRGVDHFLSSPPASWAVASAWDCGGVFRLEVRGASRLRRGAAAATRALDRVAKWLRVPSVPDFFRPFAGWFVYGLGGDGRDAAVAAEALFSSVVNMARGSAAAVAVEVAALDPLRSRIPHWRRLSCAEDLWCMKRLGAGDGHADGWDWARSAPGKSIFVDPREV
ncbi:putative N-acetyltransferase HLS1-like [Dichanthelium oligosanthes]|uniref:Putative N-acetyltransferase HLS1-like n=1 Tax=Dichanthelium oligosanthes TaxID=888268 RepID=A0A1E5W681_9POAL|nr:putative N-acetyltransferase HLS1-like [Dichanthelium oligosanthes]